MPIYEYRCPSGHRHERLRKYDERNDEARCIVCTELCEPVLTVPHVGPDGIYSYAPNIGSADAFERKQAKIDKRRAERKDGIRRRGAIGDNEL